MIMLPLSTVAAFLAVAANSADAVESMSMSMSAPILEAEMSMSMPEESSMRMRTRNLRTNFLSRRVTEDISMSMSAPILEAEMSMSMPEESSMRMRMRNLRNNFLGRRVTEDISMSMSAPILEAEMSMSMPELRARDLRVIGAGTRRTQTEASIKCVYNSGFEDAASHAEACAELDDEHSVAYTCDGEYTKVCCTVSSIVMPVFSTFGVCQKNDDEADNYDALEDMSISMSMPEAIETEEPTPSPIETDEPTPSPTPGSEEESESAPASDINSISCTWKSSFDDAASHLKACKKLNNEFSVPYACDGKEGKMQVCCTVSVIETANFEKFGQCAKI